MPQLDERARHEIEHGKLLAASGNPETIWWWGSPAGQKRAQRRGQLLTQGAQLKPGLRVLEVGCGTGLFTEMMAQSGASILAVDISPDLIELARKRVYPVGTVELAVMRFEDCDINEPFDAIVGSSVLHHLDIPLALRRMYELLKPGGMLVFAEPNMLNPQIFLQRNIGFLRESVGESPDETAIRRWELAKQLATVGFSQIDIRNTDWLHPSTPPTFIPLLWNVGLVLEHIPFIREFSGSVLIRAQRPL